MASASLFSTLPTFPEDIPVAQMSKISLANLVAGNTTEASAVLDSCSRLGFFLLDLIDHSIGREMIQEVDAVFEVVRKTMQLDMDEKTKYNQDPPRDFLGYVIASLQSLSRLALLLPTV